MIIPSDDDVIRYYPPNSETYDVGTVEKVTAHFREVAVGHQGWQEGDVDYLSSTNSTGWKKGRLEIRVVFIPNDDETHS